MRTITTDTIIQNIKEMCIEANYSLTSDVKDKLYQAAEEENSPLGRQILSQLKENLQIAKDDEIPICQDTGMAVVFLRIGQDVHIEGQNLEDAVNEGIRQGYIEGYLRKSVVSDPILRENTKDNTPGVIHYEIIAGENIEITVAPKGFGSENMSRVCMLKPADGIEGVKNAVIETVKIAGPNACPPVVVGVGVGGTFEKCAILAKKALTRDLNTHNEISYVADLEKELLEKINKLEIAPNLATTYDVLNLLVEAIAKAGYNPGVDVQIAMDAAASELYDVASDRYIFPGESRMTGKEIRRNSEEMVQFYEDLVTRYPIYSIEDGLDENDMNGWKVLTYRLGKQIQLVGDDLFVTNKKRLLNGIEDGIANSILVKVNQIGTLTEAMDAVETAHKAGYSSVISHRSGETEDTFIADLAVAMNCGQIKTGAPARSERTAKYNQLIRIEEELGKSAVYGID